MSSQPLHMTLLQPASASGPEATDAWSQCASAPLRNLTGIDLLNLVRAVVKLVQAEPKGRSRSLRDQERLQQGRSAVLTLRRAAELMHGDDKVNRRWLRAQKGLIRKAANGDDVVVWGDVLDRLPKRDGDTSDESSASTRAARRVPAGLRRVDLGSL